MSIATSPIPQNPAEFQAYAEALQAVLAAQENEIAARNEELYNKTLHIEKLKMQIAALRRARFGRSSEKLNQLELLLEDMEFDLSGSLAGKDEEDSPQDPDEKNPQSRKRGKPVRKPLPSHLPRERVEHAGAAVCKECGGTSMTQIGVDEREVLEYVPSHFKVIVHARPKMGCRCCEKITQPPMPSLPIERGIPGPGLLAHILVSKYCDHLPLYRQNVIYARQGVEIDTTTMVGWVVRMAFLLRPLAETIAAYTRAGETAHADDTVLPVLAPGAGQTKTGRLWVLARDERPFGSHAPPAVYFQYAPDRKGGRADELLKGFKGFLHADAYGGFSHLYKVDPVTKTAPVIEVACWAHARRYIYEEWIANKLPAAKELLDIITKMFNVEDTVKGQLPDVRLKARQELSVLLLDALKLRMDDILGKISTKSTFAEAIRYSTNRWAALARYTTDGRLEICNNIVERTLRTCALGRRNWLFAGSDVGGDSAAVMYTLIGTAKLCGLNPEAYLREVISRIADHPMKQIGQLLPWNIGLQKI